MAPILNWLGDYWKNKQHLLQKNAFISCFQGGGRELGLTSCSKTDDTCWVGLSRPWTSILKVSSMKDKVIFTIIPSIKHSDMGDRGLCQWKGPWHEKVLKTTFVDHCIDICYVLKSIIQAFLLISRPSVLGTDGTASAIWRTWKPLMTSAAISDTHLCQSNPTPSRLWVAFSSATFWYVTIVPWHAEDLWQSLGLRYQPQGLGLDPIKDRDQEEMSDLKSVPAHKDMVYDIT